MQVSQRYKFSDRPNMDIPASAAEMYAIWDGVTLIYCGMSRRQYEAARSVSSSVGLPSSGLKSRWIFAKGRLADPVRPEKTR
jgi:hypothetical protein